jgi:DNA-3-methyladenine glycosylase
MSAQRNSPSQPDLGTPLPREFYARDTTEVARDLLGRMLVHDDPDGLTAGIIVETEAYMQGDPGCHAARGQTARNAPMFGPPGTIYVYLIYGMHHCLNLVTQPEGVGEAVLIRALEPVHGLELMRKRRGRADVQELTTGPAKLTQALGVDRAHNAGDITQGPLYVSDGPPAPGPILTTTRIGLSTTRGAELPLRYCLRDSVHLSRSV